MGKGSQIEERIVSRKHKSLVRGACSVAIALALGGCLGGSDLNTESAVYTPEEKPLGVIAPDDFEAKPGDAVILNARIIGTTNGETLKWEQFQGEPLDLNIDTESNTASFTIPDSLVSGLLGFRIYALDVNGEVAVDESGDQIFDEVEVTVFDPDSVLQLDSSDASTILTGVELVTEGEELYIQGANNGAHTADIEPGMSVGFPITAAPGFYTLNVRYAIPSDYGGKVAGVDVNGVEYLLEFNATGQWEEVRVGVVEITEGDNLITVGGGWNYYRVDSISLIPSAEPPEALNVGPELVTEASQETKDLMQFLSESYLTSTLSGQTEFPVKEGDSFPLLETQKITQATGDDSPAIIAFDYMNYSSTYAGGDAQGLTESIIAHKAERNFIVSALFHWRAPSGNVGEGDGSFYTSGTSFDFSAALADTASPEYAQLTADMDTVAIELKKLQEAGIPVLWRPLHEAEGEWFWWGTQGPGEYKKLWTLMFERFTDYHGLDNLVWIFTHTDGLGEEWYPGDNMVDIVGYDGYGEPRNDDTHTFSSQFKTLQERHNGKKMVALTETGTIPEVSLMHAQDAMWSFFITWNSEFWDPDSVIGPQGAAPQEVDENYAFAGVTNAEDLPGGRQKVSGLYTGFEHSVNEWEAQLNWNPTDGITVSDRWSDDGAHSLELVKDMTVVETLDNIVMQAYPVEGINVEGANTLTITAASFDAGSNVVAHVFYKADDGTESWPDAIALGEEQTTLSIDVSGVSKLTGLGVRFMGLDGTQSQATFAIDNISIDGEVFESFEPSTNGWEGQVNWSPVSGATVSRAWSSTGAQSLALYQDLSSFETAENIVLQVYPEGGLDVSEAATLSMQVFAEGAGSSVDAHMFFKAPDGVESWPDAVAVGAEGTELSIDVSQVSTIDGLGVRFNSVDSASKTARFYIDELTKDALVIDSFENTYGFELQVNWTPVTGLTISQEWADKGSFSLMGSADIEDGDEVVIQSYPTGGLLLAAGVSTLNVTAYVEDSNADTTAKLWAKDKDGMWRDAGAVALGTDSKTLSLDISDITELQGFGVQFQGLNASQSNFHIDTITFE